MIYCLVTEKIQNLSCRGFIFRMPASGTYLVQITDRPAQKVVVMK